MHRIYVHVIASSRHRLLLLFTVSLAGVAHPLRCPGRVAAPCLSLSANGSRSTSGDKGPHVLGRIPAESVGNVKVREIGCLPRVLDGQHELTVAVKALRVVHCDKLGNCTLVWVPARTRKDNWLCRNCH